MNPLNPENVLQVLSPGNRAMIENLTAALSRLEAEAEALELAGDESGADETWGRAAEVEDTLEGVLAELIEESGTDTGWRTSEDEYEYDFGPSVYEALFRIGFAVEEQLKPHPPAMSSHFGIQGVDTWPTLLTTRFLEASDRADVVWAAGQSWRRTPLQDLDDPKRPADAKATCITYSGQPCGPCYGVWTGEDGRIVGPQTLIDLRVKPAETREECLMRRIGDAVRNALRRAYYPDERWTDEQVANLPDVKARLMALDAFNCAERHFRNASCRLRKPDELGAARAWLATQRRAA